MTGPLRNNQGCWTCRLRAKKCDERRDTCSTCERLSIPCYGFGLKPDWMDDEETRGALSDNLKEIVKHTSRRKTTSSLPSRRRSPVRIASGPADHSVNTLYSRLESSSYGTTNGGLDRSLAQQDGCQKLEAGHLVGAPMHKEAPRPNTNSILAPSARDSVLLLHYLDVVFSLQYPMHEPEMGSGRGWLLSSLLRAKPFYHIVLALSIHHQQAVLHVDTSQTRRLAAVVEQEQHLAICLDALSQAAENSCPTNGMATASAVIQLFYYQLFIGSSTWRTHCQAAINMYRRGQEMNFAPFGLAEKSRQILSLGSSLSDVEPVVAEQVSHFRFLRATLTWLDVTMAVTAGTAPQLLSSNSSEIAPGSRIRFDTIMGYEKRIMLQIGHIATISAHKIRRLDRHDADCSEFAQTVKEIRKELRRAESENPWGRPHLSRQKDVPSFTVSPAPSAYVTRCFAYMADVYLHLVVHGYSHLALLDTVVVDALDLLKVGVPTSLLSAIVCPLFVVGSIVKPEDEEILRGIFSSRPVLDPALRHRERILPVLEEIWKRRRTISGFEWKDVLELSHDILLI